MQIGEVIRSYRKSKNMTQEEMAVRLGVTAPAVSKWEKGNTFPDITLLAPIARLLGITTDTLLSFRDELTAEEIKAIVWESDRMFAEKSYDEALEWGREKLEQYPNCEQLIWQMAAIFDMQRKVQELPNEQEYDGYIGSLYRRALESQDEIIRSRAADLLFYFYLKKKQYEQAEECLDYFSLQNPERKLKQARLYGETNRIQEAYKIYEELLFSDYGRASAELQGMYLLAMRENDRKRAHMLADKLSELASCFEMGKYHEVCGGLELATLEQDADAVVAIAQEMLSDINQMYGFVSSPLYEHMKFQEIRPEFMRKLKEDLQCCFREEESYGFLKNDKRWQELSEK